MITSEGLAPSNQIAKSCLPEGEVERSQKMEWPDAELLLDGIGSAVLVLSSNLTIHFCSRRFLDILGYGKEDLRGLSMAALFRDESRGAEWIGRLVDEVSARGTTEGRLELVAKGGEARDLRFRAGALGREGGELVIAVEESRGEADASRGAASGGEQALRDLARLYDENPSPVLRVSREGYLLYANRASWPVLSHWQTEVGRKVTQTWQDAIGESLQSGENREEEFCMGFKTYLLVFVPVSDMSYVNVFGLDVTTRKQVERKLLLDAQVFENTSEAIVITDTDLRILDVNLAFQNITGYSREEALGEKVSILRSGRHDKLFYAHIRKTLREKGSWQGEVWDRRKNGEIYPKWLSISCMLENGSVARYVGLFSDLSTMRHTQEQLYYMAHYDSLTGLANRRHFLDRLKIGLEDARRTKERIAVLFIDLDGFKQVNDTYGHRAGDQLLREAANRIKNSLRQSDTVARMGGDEFTAILPHLKNVQDSVVAAQKMIARMGEPMLLEQREVLMSSSVGISIFPDDATEADSLLACADTALYRAKELGKNCHQFYSPELNKRAEEILSMKAKMRRGIDLGEFYVFYQPQVEAGTGRAVGVEALARWNSRELGAVPPDRFIPLAEETGMIHEIGELVLRLACRQARTWKEEGLPDLLVAVNVSAVQVRRSDFAGIAEAVIAAEGMPAGGLEIEITESTLLGDEEQVIQQLHRLKDLGATLAIDDFGIKYSSLSYLRRLPIDRLKIDSSFVRDLSSDKGSLAIAVSIIAMGHGLELEVVAEGVETEAQAAILAAKGCDYFQGHLFSEAVPGEQIGVFARRSSVSGWLGLTALSAPRG